MPNSLSLIPLLCCLLPISSAHWRSSPSADRPWPAQTDPQRPPISFGPSPSLKPPQFLTLSHSSVAFSDGRRLPSLPIDGFPWPHRPPLFTRCLLSRTPTPNLPYISPKALHSHGQKMAIGPAGAHPRPALQSPATMPSDATVPTSLLIARTPHDP